MVINFYLDINLIVKLFKETDIYKIKFSYDSPESNEFVDLLAKNLAFLNIEVLLKNYKIRTSKN